jgi:hypothetical protein
MTLMPAVGVAGIFRETGSKLTFLRDPHEAVKART